MECDHFKNGRCMQDPKYHKPDETEITTYCGSENYCYCPIFEKYSGLEGMSCGWLWDRISSGTGSTNYAKHLCM